MNKFNIGETVYYYQYSLNPKLVAKGTVQQIVQKPDSIYYYVSGADSAIKADLLMAERKVAYKSLILRAENEMTEPE